MKNKLHLKSNFNKSIVLLMLLFGLFAICTSFNKTVTVTLPEDKDFLQIPGVGWQTFYRTADADKTLSGLRFKSGCAYFRFYWNTVEPKEGQFAFGMMDSLLQRCRQNNQTLAFRIMCENPSGEGMPKWLIEKGVKRTYIPCPQEGAHYAPDMSDSLFQFYHQRLIRAFGKRYDGHPDLALVDIGSVGMWGEWHIYCAPNFMPDRAIRKAITDLYYEVFPNTPLTALVGDTTNVDYAVTRGHCGWRGDSWGDAPAPGRNWNHHVASYRPTNKRLPDAWKTGTVALEPGEPGGTLKGILAPINDIVDDAIAWHATFAQNKSNPIPPQYIPAVEQLVMKMGFRLVLRNLTYVDEAHPGSEIPLTMKWENLGIAPPYRDHRISFRLKDTQGEDKAVEITDISILGWLPGEKNITVNYKLPKDLKKGDYILEMGLVFHNASDHTIPIANKGKTSDGWYSLGRFKVS